MLKLKYFNNVNRFLFKYIFLLNIFFFLFACTNKYYLDKRLDNFYFKENDTYAIYSNPHITYNELIRVTLKEYLSPLPLKFSNCYASYLIYFNYKKRYFWLPVFRLTIIKNSSALKGGDEVVYDSVVYSYNTHEIKSLLASLVIISNDLLYQKYSKNKYVNISKNDIKDFSKNIIQDYNGKEVLNSEKPPKRETIYRLYTNKELYNN